MGKRFRTKIAAGKDKQELKVLRTQLVQLAGYVRIAKISTESIIRAMVEHLNIEAPVRELLKRYEEENKAAIDAANNADGTAEAVAPAAQAT